jgi:hypothetical protein
MYLVDYATRKSVQAIVVGGFADEMAMLDGNPQIAAY